jgi:spore maturation protein CgeB
VTYLPFGYDERYFFRDDSASHTDELSSDAIFVGAGDADRVPWINAMFAAGIDVALYGSFWDRFPETRGRSRGQVDPDTLRRATRAARTAVCLVRRANRDGHVMRSFEIPAIGTCMVAEDTDEHRSIFGPEGRSVLYFDSPEIMVERVRTLLDNSMERERLASAAHSLIVNGKHTYTDRLHSMIAMLER